MRDNMHVDSWMNRMRAGAGGFRLLEGRECRRKGPGGGVRRDINQYPEPIPEPRARGVAPQQ